MSAPPVSWRRSVAGLLALLSCAAVLTLSACDTSSESSGTGGGSGGGTAEHGGGHPTEHGGGHPSSEHRTTAPTSRPSEYNPANCPTGLVCSPSTP
ncbi:hypothetical protein ACR9E3_23010 [Actinomycetospora sp. C-140]